MNKQDVTNSISMKKYIGTGFGMLFFCGICFAQPVVGKLAPEISLKDSIGNIANLSDFKGKIVLIDFWASWCVPCRRSNKELVRVYQKYKEKGFEIFGISLDTKEADWKKAIIADKTKWIQVTEPAGWEAPVGLAWGIEQLPTSYLVSKDGVIVSINPTKSQLEKYLKRSAR